MAMQAGGGKKPYNEINITPFVDVVLVLLIIFILMTTAAVQGIKVDLPSASSAKTLEAQKSRVIAVSNDGTVSIETLRLEPRSQSGGDAFIWEPWDAAAQPKRTASVLPAPPPLQGAPAPAALPDAGFAVDAVSACASNTCWPAAA